MSHDLDPANQSIKKDITTLPAIWTDQQGISWQVELTDQHVRFQQGDEVFLIPAQAWPTDISITMHNDDAVLRFETFDKSLVFVLPASKAKPLISHVSKPTTNQIIEQQASIDARRVRPILWPNVSPLALWALACSAFTFVPVVGPLFAVVSFVLVSRHRQAVRPSRAWEHSRVLCRVSVALALVGLVVCALATFSFYTQPPTHSTENPQPTSQRHPIFSNTNDNKSQSLKQSTQMGPSNHYKYWYQKPPEPRALDHSITRSTWFSRCTPRKIGITHATSNRSSQDHLQQTPNNVTTTESESTLRDLKKSKYSYAKLSPMGTTKANKIKSQTIMHTTIAQSGMPWEGDHNWGLILSGLVVLLLSLTVHEAAHAITAWWLGDDFGKRLGRVTLNPLAHIDPIGTVLLPLILFMTGAGVFGWAKPVPVRTELLRNPRRDHIYIAAAGPASNILLAAISLMLLLGLVCAIGLFAPDATMANLVTGFFSSSVKVTGIPAAVFVGAICTILQLSFFLNMFLACFNLIPIPPLDGSWILEHTFPNSLGPIYAKIRPYGFMIFLLAMYTNVLDEVLGYAMYALLPGMWLLVNCPHI